VTSCVGGGLFGRGFNGEDAFSAYGSYEFALGSGARR
jgi:hypothetical protein